MKTISMMTRSRILNSKTMTYIDDVYTGDNESDGDIVGNVEITNGIMIVMRATAMTL